jgi:hypothetical protein
MSASVEFAFHPGAAAEIAAAREAAVELFGNCGGVEAESDPEAPHEQYYVVSVVAAGEFGDVIDRELRWHERLRELAPDQVGDFRLAVDYRS